MSVHTDRSDAPHSVTVPAPDALAADSWRALARYQEATAERSRAERALVEHLSPVATELYRTLSDAESEAQGASTELHVAELVRHFPGLAPALRLAWAHVIDCRLDAVGSCCTAGGPIDP